MDKPNTNRDITAKEFLRGLTKGVLGTTFIEPSKFPSISSNSEIGKPYIGRTYFSDRLKHDCPIDHNTVDKIIYLYKTLLNGETYFDKESICNKVIEFLANTFSVDVCFLTPFITDNNDIQSIKSKSILSLIDTISQTYIDQYSLPKSSFSIDNFELPYTLFLELNVIADDNSLTKHKLDKWEKTYIHQSDETINSQISKKTIGESGIPILIYGYAGMLSDNFVQSLISNGSYDYTLIQKVTDEPYYPHHNRGPYDIHETIYVSKQKFDELLSKDDLFALNIEVYRSAYSKKLINNSLSNGKCICIVGGIREFNNMKKYYPSTLSIIILPKDIRTEIKHISFNRSIGDVIYNNINNLSNILNELAIHDPNALLIVSDNNDLSTAVHTVEDYINISSNLLSNCKELVKQYKKEIKRNVGDASLREEIRKEHGLSGFSDW